MKYFNSGPDGTNGTGAAQLAKETFCPDVASANIDVAGPIGRVAQKTYPNMLFGALLRGPNLYVPNVGAQPEPPVNFNTNVQALVGVLSTVINAETPFSVNLNTYVPKEATPASPTTSLDKLFLNDIVAMDADKSGKNFLIVSRGGNYVIRATIGTDFKLTTLDANNVARRFQTGNLPSGVVMARSGLRAYVNNELNTSISALNLQDNTVIARDIESSAPPAPGTQAHRNLVGKLAFFTALGIPDKLDNTGDGQFDVALRDINPLANRGKASNNAWSSCASCHDDGHSDNVTWIFETGPRQTIPLEGTFARNNLDDQRILNWSAVRGSNTDFNNNARGIQGGVGFATNVDGSRQDHAGVQPRPDQGHQRFAGRDERVGGDGARADHAGHRCRMPKPAAVRLFLTFCAELPWRHEVDQEPHERPLPGQPAAAGGSGRPGVLHGRSAEERRRRQSRRPADSQRDARRQGRRC